MGLFMYLCSYNISMHIYTFKQKQIRNVAFGNFFGVLALSQSTRLSKVRSTSSLIAGIHVSDLDRCGVRQSICLLQ